uniref:RRM domain-containing protein n=1 Tax=Romanomermis culicivorax TaxID=13658 RepID=A0A915KGH7_ROMCU
MKWNQNMPEQTKLYSDDSFTRVMNPLTNVKNLQKLNERELRMGFAGDDSRSWHQKYRDSAWIFIGGLNFELSEGDLIAVFSQYGEIVNINLIRDKQTGKSRGFGFLCYEDQRSTNLAVDNLNGIKIANRIIRVDHVEEYKIPKERGDEDDIVKRLHLEGCAPEKEESSKPEKDVTRESEIEESRNSVVKIEKPSIKKEVNTTSTIESGKRYDDIRNKHRNDYQKSSSHDGKYNKPDSVEHKSHRKDNFSSKSDYQQKNSNNGNQPEKRTYVFMIRNIMKSIGTHNGTFHCDEALACFMLKCLPRFSDAKVVRTRDPQLLKKCDVVVDVGGEYDPSSMRFDHHQRSFNLSLKSIESDLKFETKLSSAGLIYAHFGREIIREVLKNEQSSNMEEKSSIIEILFKKCYAEFVEEIDAKDNGIDQFSSELKPKFLVTTTLSNRVAALNPSWNDKEPHENEQFEKAMQLVGEEFIDRITYFHGVWWPARSIVLEAFRSRNAVDISGAIMILEQVCPWKEHLFDIEIEDDQEGAIKYCTFHDDRNDYWMIIAVPIEPKSFTCRKPFPESWRGLRDQELSKTIEIEKCVFVHATGFCGANKTKEGALKMIKKSLSALSD